VASDWVSSLGEKYESKTCTLWNVKKNVLTHGVKKKKAAIEVFIVVKNLHGRFREEEFDGYVLFCVLFVCYCYV
jgi:hypothetical protein